MQIQYKAGRIVHIDNAIGRDLIARKLAVEVLPAPKPVPNTSWQVSQGALPEHGPYIHAHCSTCGLPSFCGGAAAHTTKFAHCQVIETPPAHIVKQYADAYRAWKSGEEPRPSSVSPAQREIEKKRFEALRTHRVKTI